MNMFSQAGMLPAAAQCLLLEITGFYSTFNSQGSWWGTGQTQKVAKKAQGIFSELCCSTRALRAEETSSSAAQGETLA